jgi:NitT/TauT family transport system substrate-binding protein
MNNRFRGALGCGVALALAGLAMPKSAVALDQITIGVTGPAGAEHGGYYQALAYGIYAGKYGLDVTLSAGGSQVDLARLLAAGEIDFSAGGSAPEQWRFTESGIPVTTIAVIFQKDPLVVFAHPAAGVDGFKDLAGRTVFVPDRARDTVWPWLKKRYGLGDEQERSYAADLAPFLTDRSSVLLGDLTAEGFAIKRDGGFEPVVLLPTEDSYYTYTGTVQTSWRLVRDRPELVQRFVDATIEGWNNYLYGDNEGQRADQGRQPRDDRRAARFLDRGLAEARHRRFG